MKSYIITVIGNALSERLSNECISSAKEFANVTPAVWQATTPETIQETVLNFSLKINTHAGRKLSGGEIGCFLSHYRLWQECIRVSEPVVILEHDGEIIRELPDNSLISNDTDIVFLDPYRPHPMLNPAYHNTVLATKDLPVKLQTPVLTASDVNGKFKHGTYGYIVSPSGAEKLINAAARVGVLPSDVFIGTDIVDIKVTSVPVVRLHPHYSTVDAIMNDSLTSPTSRNSLK